jgi:hypothetical protein
VFLAEMDGENQFFFCFSGIFVSFRTVWGVIVLCVGFGVFSLNIFCDLSFVYGLKNMCGLFFNSSTGCIVEKMKTRGI